MNSSWTVENLQQTVRAFQSARIILSANELRIFDALFQEQACDELARKLNVKENALEILLNALVSLGLLKKSHHTYINSPFAQKYLTSEGSESLVAQLDHVNDGWKNWSQLTHVVQRGELKYRGRRFEDPKQHRAFIKTMHRRAYRDGAAFVEKINLEKEKRILDLGGGSGAYLMACLDVKPQLEAVLFDLPQTIPIAREIVADRYPIKYVEGDFLKDDIGSNYDLIILSNIIHSLSFEHNQFLIQKAYQALNPGGRIIIQDFILDENKTAPLQATLFAVHMLVNTLEGRTYTRSEIESWLTASGFHDFHYDALNEVSKLVFATK